MCTCDISEVVVKITEIEKSLANINSRLDHISDSIQYGNCDTSVSPKKSSCLSVKDELEDDSKFVSVS